MLPVCRMVSAQPRSQPDPPPRRQAKRRPVMVGIAGGIGSGKSSVAKLLGEFGAVVIDADAMAHAELETEEVRDTLVNWWGPSILASDGKPDRKRIGAIVFDDPTQRTRLEGLIHPRIAAKRDEMIERLADDPTVKMIVMDAPLLYEVGLDGMCDSVIFVESDQAVRAERSEKTRHWEAEELARRENSQIPLDKKRSKADHICNNNSDLPALRQEVKGLYELILAKDGSF